MDTPDANVGLIGAGICGLWIARALGARGQSTFTLEKSRGLGGRLATRRTERHRFDHGAQFYNLRPESAAAHALWHSLNLVRRWPDHDHDRFCASGGMTALAKALPAGEPVHLGARAARIERTTLGWTARTDAGHAYAARAMVLTCPVPQALELLRASDLAFDPELERLTYAQALVALLEGVRSPAGLAGPDGDARDLGPPIASVVDQHAKGVSAEAAWTVTMTPEFSKAHFDHDDALDLILNTLRARDPALTCDHASLKKWRYAEPEAWLDRPFAEVAPNLYLAGDGFGGPSINGALRSAAGLIAHLAAKV